MTIRAHNDPESRSVRVYHEITSDEGKPALYVTHPIDSRMSPEVVSVHPGEEPPYWLNLTREEARAVRDALNETIPPEPPAKPAPTLDDRLLRIIENLSASRGQHLPAAGPDGRLET